MGLNYGSEEDKFLVLVQAGQLPDGPDKVFGQPNPWCRIEHYQQRPVMSYTHSGDKSRTNQSNVLAWLDWHSMFWFRGCLKRHLFVCRTSENQNIECQSSQASTFDWFVRTLSPKAVYGLTGLCWYSETPHFRAVQDAREWGSGKGVFMLTFHHTMLHVACNIIPKHCCMQLNAAHLFHDT